MPVAGDAIGAKGGCRLGPRTLKMAMRHPLIFLPFRLCWQNLSNFKAPRRNLRRAAYSLDSKRSYSIFDNSLGRNRNATVMTRSNWQFSVLITWVTRQGWPIALARHAHF